MYMASAEILCWGPNTTYIPLAHVRVFCVECNANFMFRHGGNTNFNASIFASQWNIGLLCMLLRIESSGLSPYQKKGDISWFK